MVKFFLTLIVTLFFVSAFSQESDDKQYSLFKSKTYVKNPLDLRDPFKRKITKKKNQISKQNQLSGIYDNNHNSIETKPIENIKIIGIIIGPQRRAMAQVNGDVRGTDGALPIYYIKEGMKIGENGAEVKAILPGGIVLVEKIRNVYDQDEYLETVIPVSNE
jgi:Tfp pilus assembly protein PilP